MLEYLKGLVLPAHMNQIGIFVQRNDIIEDRQGRRLESHVEQVQRGVARTNCIDCLDRTNVAQQMMALETLIAMVPCLGEPN